MQAGCGSDWVNAACEVAWIQHALDRAAWKCLEASPLQRALRRRVAVVPAGPLHDAREVTAGSALVSEFGYHERHLDVSVAIVGCSGKSVGRARLDMDAASLVAAAHGEALRHISAAKGRRFEGFGAAARSMRRGPLRQRLIRLDVAALCIRHVRTPTIAAMVQKHELELAVADECSRPPSSTSSDNEIMGFAHRSATNATSMCARFDTSTTMQSESESEHRAGAGDKQRY